MGYKQITPTITTASVDPDANTYTASGTQQRLRKRASLDLTITWTAFDSNNAAGAWTISGLRFAANGLQRVPCQVEGINLDNTSLGLFLEIADGAKTGTLVEMFDGAVTANLATTAMSATAELKINGDYSV